MDSKKLNSDHKAMSTFFALFIILMFSFVSCSKKMHFEQSSVVPAAEGTVKWKKDKNQNYSISVDVIRLSQPNRLQPPKNTYIVWMNTNANGVKNIGQLKSSSGFLSKTLKASLQAVTPFEPVSFFITAEEDGATSNPGTQVVLRTK